MVITFSSYSISDIPAVKRLNQRFKDANSDLTFPETNISSVFPKEGEVKLYIEYFLAKDENGEVRGGYFFKNQEFYINGKDVEIVFMQWPLSEGVINAEYKHVGGLIIKDMEQRRKIVYSLGMGGFEYPLPKRLKKNGWYMYLLPFYFFIVKPGAFLNEFEYIKTLRKSAIKNIIINIVRLFGLLYIFVFFTRIYTAIFRLIRLKKYRDINIEVIEEFSSFADELWEKNKDYYSIIAKRDSSILNRLYLKTELKFRKLKINKNENCIGWVVLLCTKMYNDKYFGNLKLGSVIDGFSNPEHSDLLLYKSIEYLKKSRADLIIANHANVRWGKHFKRNGFIKGPSNFILASSKGLKEYFENDIDFENSFLMRGDGDGPIHL